MNEIWIMPRRLKPHSFAVGEKIFKIDRRPRFSHGVVNNSGIIVDSEKQKTHMPILFPKLFKFIESEEHF